MLHEMHSAHRRGDLAKRLRAPMRIGNQRAPERNEVGAACLQNRFGILRRDDAPGDDHRYAESVLHGRAYGSRHRRGNDGGWMQKRDNSGALVGSAREIDRHDALPLERLRQADEVLVRIAAVGKFGRAQPDQHRELGKLGSNQTHGLEEHSHPIPGCAPVVIVAPVEPRREELLKQIAVGRVNFDGVVAGAPQPPRRVEKILLDLVRSRRLASARTGSPVAGLAARRRADRLHAEHRAAQQLAAVIELRDGQRAVRRESRRRARSVRE